MAKRTGTRDWALLTAIVLTGMILRFWRLADLGLIGDESYYWLWSRFPALAYFDHPGGVAWLSGLSTLLGGEREFGLRWLNALLGACSPILVYGLGRRLGSTSLGLLAATIVSLAPPYIVVSRFVYTDALPLFLLLANLNLLWPLVTAPRGETRRLPWWHWLSIAVTWALLLNTKISVYPYFVGLGLGILLWRSELLRSAALWRTLLAASLGLLPFLAWNATHHWAGLAWVWQHFARGTGSPAGPLSQAYHMLTYLTPPLVILCLPGLLLWRDRRGRWLVLTGLLLLLPVLLSPANSPRNLLLGCSLLIPASAAWLTAPGRRQSWRIGTVVFLLAWLVLYGLGTTQALIDESALPQSSIARAIRQDAIGWRTLAQDLNATEDPILTVDYSAASQLWYYAGRPVYTHWGQYLVWGVPEFREGLVLSLEYVPEDLITDRLRTAFQQVQGPQKVRFEELGTSKVVHIWKVEGLRIDQQSLLQELDLLDLVESAR